MQRRMVGFFQDEAGDWVTRLDCHHTQHVRHAPPLSERPWVLTSQGRESRLGQPRNCLRCDALEWPKGLTHYKSTPEFTQDTLPQGLRKEHNTKAGVWAKIVVLRGELLYEIPALSYSQVLTPEHEGVVLPEVLHKVTPCGEVSLRVDFFK